MVEDNFVVKTNFKPSVLQNNKELIVEYEGTYKKSNEFGRAFLSKKMTVRQYQLFSFIVNQTQHIGGTYFHKDDLERMYGKKFTPDELYKNTDALTSLKISFTSYDTRKLALDNNESMEKFAHILIFDKVYYEDGMIYVRWSQTMQEHLINMKRTYFINSLDVIGKFTSSYTYVIYNLIKSFYYNTHLDIPIGNLLKYFNLPENSIYRTKSYALRTRILDVVKKEIDTHTELELDYEIKRKGRRIDSVMFTWTRGKLLYNVPKEKLEEMHVIADKIQLKGLQLLSVPEISNDKNKINFVKNTLKDVTEMLPIADNAPLRYEEAEVRIEQLKNKYNDLVDLERRKDKPEPIPFYNWLEERE